MTRALRAVIAGVLIAAGIGFGAYSVWWIAMLLGIPLIIGGLAVLPRPGRAASLPTFAAGGPREGVPVLVTALNRSTFDVTDAQPTLVSARITPHDDTAYDARWITMMSRVGFQTTVHNPRIALAPDDLPPRTGTEPDLTAGPGWATFLPPAIAIVVGAVVLFGVGDSVWRIDTPNTFASSRSGSGSGSGPAAGEGMAQLGDRRDRLVQAIDDAGPDARANVLAMTFDASGSDRAEVYDPATGQSVSLTVREGGEVDQRRSPTTKRRGDTFATSVVASTDLSRMAATMTERTTAFAGAVVFDDMVVERPDTDEDVLITASYRNPEHITETHDIQATPAGEVAEFFDPGDFEASFGVLRAALVDAGVPLDRPALNRLEIRGLGSMTPTMYAGDIQSSGGVLAEFVSGRNSGEVSVVPGAFPTVDLRSWSPGDLFAFTDVTPAVFDKVRDQAMRRGDVEEIDRAAVDIQMTTTFQRDGNPVIQVAVGRSDGSEGTYSPSGVFLRDGVR
ncbi:hypothetical protein GYA93_05180 [Gordonia desulfuricans]|uniref:Uncharacterized protein n=1 Tax=Gordonia desulfuricans TaxID=89051 RepID=A0A7K3LL62_9ACTN|nr:hypothetical protein [Gordonia desulfuricans]NDK88974.1 hypothetical protein [Gordonia desulfuricans]